MESLVMWVLLVLIQQHGMQGITFGTQAECEETRTTVRYRPEVLAVSECTQLTLTGQVKGEKA